MFATPRGDNLGELKPFEMEAQPNWGFQLTISPVRHSPREMSVFTPPNAKKQLFDRRSDKSAAVLGKLIELHKMGVISKEELRMKVLQWDPASSTSSTVPVPTASAATTARDALVEAAEPEKNIKAESGGKAPAKKKKGEGKPVTEDARLRKLVREPTRRRFFRECQNTFSILWQRTASGSFSMHKALFNKAAQDPINLVYSQHPAQTRGVTHSAMMAAVLWQVTRDRYNWKGKTPIRKLVSGPLLPFDWHSELQNLYLSEGGSVAEKKVAEIASSSPKPIPPEQLPANVAEKIAHRPIPPFGAAVEQMTHNTSNRAINVDLCRICFTCGVGVWIGSPKSPPHDVPIAYPLGSDWSNDNIQPYCETCWNTEIKMLQGLSGQQYRAIGDKKKSRSATLIFPPP